MFKSIRLKNFKCYKDSTEIPLRPLTILIGANNSGKSTILQALLILKQTLDDPSDTALVTKGDFVEAGGYYDILHGKAPRIGGHFGISVTVEPSQVLLSGPGRRKPVIEMQEKLDVSFSLVPKANEIRVSECLLATGTKTLINARAGGKSWSSDEISPAEHKDLPKLEFMNFMPSFDEPRQTTKISKNVSHFITAVRFQTIAWSHFFHSHLHYIGPHREHVPWYSGIGTRVSSDLGIGGENLVAALGSTVKIGGTAKTLLQLVNQWMCDEFQVLEQLHLEAVDKAEIVRMLLGDEHSVKDINVAAMGEGVSQLIPIVSKLVSQRPGDCLAIEQPEVHLHPGLQSHLADLLIDVIQRGRGHRQVIVETHSEHLLWRVRRRVAEGTLKASDLAIIYVEKGEAESTVRELKLNEDGHFDDDDWPKGFFDQAYQDAMALVRAGSKKSKEVRP